MNCRCVELNASQNLGRRLTNNCETFINSIAVGTEGKDTDPQHELAIESRSGQPYASRAINTIQEFLITFISFFLIPFGMAHPERHDRQGRWCNDFNTVDGPQVNFDV